MRAAQKNGQQCPKCGTNLLEHHYNGLQLRSCPACKGSLAARDCLSHLVIDCDKYLELEPEKKLEDGILGGFPHAACGGRFYQYSVSRDTDLKIDVCSTCGEVWFDKDELEHARHLHEVADANKRLNKKFSWSHGLFVFLTNIPYEYNARPRRLPGVLLTIITLNILVFLLHSVGGPDPVFYPAAPKTPEWVLSIIFSTFGHADVLHIAMNMCFLYIFGDNVEDVLGRAGFALFYLAAAVFAGFAHTTMTGSPEIPCQGASGAVYGVMGAYLVYFRRARFVMPFFKLLWFFEKTRRVPPIVFIGIYIGLDLLSALLVSEDGIAHWAHLGGFVFGVLFGLLTYGPVLKRNVYLKILNAQKI